MTSSLLTVLDQQKFIKEWSDKFDALASMSNNTRSGVTSIAAAIGQNFAAVKANLDANSEALEQLDVYNQIWARMFLCLMERIIDCKELTSVEPLLTVQEIKTKAKEDFQALLQECKARVLEDRTAYIMAMRERAETEQKAATEDQTAEAALRGAEQSLSTVGGEGSAIPDGAEIFGG